MAVAQESRRTRPAAGTARGRRPSGLERGRGLLGYVEEVVKLALVIPLLLAATVAGAADLAVGSKAPPFSLIGSDGRTHTLAEHAGKSGVVLAWFPKAFTPG